MKDGRTHGAGGSDVVWRRSPVLGVSPLAGRWRLGRYYVRR